MRKSRSWATQLVVARASIVNPASGKGTSWLKPMISGASKKPGPLSIRIILLIVVVSVGLCCCGSSSWGSKPGIAMRVVGSNTAVSVSIHYNLLVLLLPHAWFPPKEFVPAVGVPSTKCCQLLLILSIDGVKFLTVQTQTQEWRSDVRVVYKRH